MVHREFIFAIVWLPVSLKNISDLYRNCSKFC